ncbi:MAG: single-stranded DNA-binding protein [Tissierellia bacterium]|nr:single-stranded DNA-binding protein [Tissierellia bacterium]MDD4726519.1 single-stranded DNA-binding protein [Tissierellia bacterium]
MDKIIEANKANLVGKVVSDKEFSHDMYGEKFYVFNLEVPRLSSSVDILPITISERLLFNFDFEVGKYVIIEGQLRSYNRFVESNNKLVLTIFAREISIPQEEDLQDKLRKPNEIYLDGFICKKPIYRTTPFGREITDILLAVNRPYNKSDYIPCIAWGRNARYCENLLVGDHLKIWGRIQSREYQKKLYNGEVETKIAFEVSISKLDHIQNDNNRIEGYELEG